MLNRRHLFSAAVGLAGAGVTLRSPGGTAGAHAAGLKAANLRGTLASAAAALRSDPVADQTALLAELIADASRRDEPLALPSGTFVVSTQAAEASGPAWRSRNDTADLHRQLAILAGPTT